MDSFNQYISTNKQCRSAFPTIPHSHGSQQDDRRWHLIYHSRPCSPLPWKLTLMRTFDNRTDMNDTWKTMPLDEPLLIAFQISAILHSFFPFLFTLMCSSFLIISVSPVHISLIREKKMSQMSIATPLLISTSGIFLSFFSTNSQLARWISREGIVQ